ncbi:hypothetical protein IHQ71_08140 [Rhizobium sp. TH2]|uniref:hypothetical protein n=1 Tax=Rhizobium sp. TH2 TaxID=2775403 RepID=UPI0021578E51|nr:hypothetical protein [Rhizobium sp. TH2]UVC10548.1 hypothetical protein IHQ71_08140 [Rhizobium sp. TH2]
MTPTNTALVADGSYAWMRLAITLAISVLSSAGMWTVVLMPTFEADFHLTRTEASYYTVVMLSFLIGGNVFGKSG